ncbi:nitrate reductase molybdenum cofactor assembly chaperone [Streptomyces sp. NPDC086787]|uniref:nitrate reductase molybdenum cofactor assembly chaperone n=1 Tax=Streptomyces sp. NPDC086787 TaxID=3365759 RepID=UPI00382DB029
MPSDAVLYQAAALCLTYPDGDLVARVPLLREAAPQLREFTDHAAVTPLGELAAHYERVFGQGSGHSLHLSRWSRSGEVSLGRFADVYREHGLEFSRDELPDFLPAVLECASRTGSTELLTDHRGALEELRSRLTDFGTPYASVLNAVCVALPAA